MTGKMLLNAVMWSEICKILL